MAKTRMYLDFDGVINADKPPFDDVVTFTHPSRVNPDKGFVIRYSPTMVAALRDLILTHDVDLVWLTTWNENSDIHGVMATVGDFPTGRVIDVIINRDDWDTNRLWTKWKADAIIADLADTDAPFIWVDDEAHKYHKKDVLAAAGDVPNLLVTPRTYWGLTPTHLDGMDSFLASN